MMNRCKSKRALISGISGQDGAYLAKFLLSKNYEVWGTSRQVEGNSFGALKKLGILEMINLKSMSNDNFDSVVQVISEIRPSEIYNLAGQSSVGLSFDQPVETVHSIISGTLNQLEAIRTLDKSIRFFNAGSGECYGDTRGATANENTAFNPTSPYAIAKATSTWLVESYRKSYELFSCTGILFNHESSLRSDRFVTKKIISTALRIAAGSNEKLKLGNLAVSRDWGWAPEYVIAMWKMLNQNMPEDFILATGETISLEDFIEVVFSELGLDWRQHVEIDQALIRINDSSISRADPTKAKEHLGWQATITGYDVPRKMLREIDSLNE
jgi:GDPmannose 4,6-dehydratase